MNICFICDKEFTQGDYFIPVEIHHHSPTLVTHSTILVHLLCGLEMYLRDETLDRLADKDKTELTGFLMKKMNYIAGDNNETRKH